MFPFYHDHKPPNVCEHVLLLQFLVSDYSRDYTKRNSNNNCLLRSKYSLPSWPHLGHLATTSGTFGCRRNVIVFSWRRITWEIYSSAPISHHVSCLFSHVFAIRYSLTSGVILLEASKTYFFSLCDFPERARNTARQTEGNVRQVTHSH